MTLYRIATLRWEKRRTDNDEWVALAEPLGFIVVGFNGDYWYATHRNSWVTHSHKTREDAQRYVEQWYQERMKAGLVEATIDDCVQYSARIASESIDAHHRKNKLGPYSEALSSNESTERT